MPFFPPIGANLQTTLFRVNVNYRDLRGTNVAKSLSWINFDTEFSVCESQAGVILNLGDWACHALMLLLYGNLQFSSCFE